MLPPLPVWKDTFRANQRTADYQFTPDIVGLSNGNFLVVWEDQNDTTAGGAGYDIVGQIYNAFGQKIGGTIFLNETYGQSRNEVDPKVVATADGGFALTYTFTANNEYDQLYRRFDAAGNPVDDFDEFVVSDGPGGTYPNDFQITQRPDGSSVIVYRSDTGTDEDILAVIVDAAGNVSAPITIRPDDDPTGNTSDPVSAKLTTLPDGRVIIALREKDNGDYDVEYAILNTNNSVQNLFAVNSDADADTDADVAALSDGGWVVTWRVGDNIYGQIYNSNGNKQGGQLDLATAPDEIRSNARVISLNDGGFALGWIDYTDKEISVRAFDATGEKATLKTDLPFEGFDAYELAMSLTADGRILLTWTDYADDTYNNAEVFSAILDPRGDTFTAPEGAITVARHEGGKINGTDGNDFIYGLEGKDHLRGLEGNDRLWGFDGNDELEGGKGNDRLKGEKGNDELGGDKGNDQLWGAKGHDRIEGDAGKDTAWGGDGNDKLWGGGGNDTLYGEGGKDTVYGGGGKDKLFGDAGNDKIYGGSSNDKLTGGGGNDKMWGGTGLDLMVGGSGADTFIYTSANDSKTGEDRRDTIFDFKSGVDKIDLSAIDADTTTSGDQAFTFIGGAAFSQNNSAGELRGRVEGGDIYLLMDRNGDRTADMEIKLESPGPIDGFDFIL